MSLSSALSIAQHALAATSRQTAIVSRNIANAGDSDYNRRIALLTSEAPGSSADQTRRAADDVLFRQNLSAAAAAAGHGTISEAMERLGLTVNGADNASTPAVMLGKLSQALQTFSATPSNRTLGANAVSAASDLARTLNAGAEAVGAFRTQTDGAIGSAVNDLKSLLQSFGEANNQVVNATRTGRDASDALDARDATLKKIAAILPVSVSTRADNDMVLSTDDGATLFETVPRSVSFTPSNVLTANSKGAAVLVDGVPVSGSADAGGKLGGLLYLRDEVGTTVSRQLDEVARGLVVAFAETGNSVSAKAGLFTWSGGPALPPAGTDGLAGTIKVNAAFDPAGGGNPVLLRDGGANGAAYVANTSGSPSYAAQLIAFGDRLDQPIALDPKAGLGASGSVTEASAGSVGWFEAVRKTASDKAETAGALAARTGEALSNKVGVNVDTEYSLLLDLEHTYQASARLMKAVDEMMSTLLSALN